MKIPNTTDHNFFFVCRGCGALNLMYTDASGVCIGCHLHHDGPMLPCADFHEVADPVVYYQDMTPALAAKVEVIKAAKPVPDPVPAEVAKSDGSRTPGSTRSTGTGTGTGTTSGKGSNR